MNRHTTRLSTRRLSTRRLSTSRLSTRRLSTRTPAATPWHSPPALLVILVSAMLGLAGCGDEPPAADGVQPTGAATDGGSPTDGGTEPANACELFSEEEAEAVAGNPVTAGQLLGVICIWEPEDLDNDAHLQVSVGYVPAPPGTDVDAVCQAGLAGIPDSEPLAGTGLGNSAYWDFQSATLANSGSLHICFDGGMLDTAAIGLRSEPELQEVAISIAETVLARL
jgi:hypothetical protein